MTTLTEMLAANQKFEEEHGGKPLRDPDTGNEVYPDGTERMFSDVINAYQIWEPVQPEEKLRARRKYLALQLRLECRDFDSFKADCVQAARYAGQYINQPGMPLDAAELLRAGAKRIAALNRQLDQLDREIGQLPDEVARRAYLEQHNRQAQARRQQAVEIQSLEY
jgi:hypothetical protein